MTDGGEFKSALLVLIPQLRAYAVALCRCRDKADDLVQEALLKAWSHRHTLRDPDRLKPWLLAILRNEQQQDIRRRKRSPAAPVRVDDDDDAQAVDAPQPAVVALNQVRAALDRLPIEEREALILVGLEELTYEEAAAICHCPVGTLKSRVSAARRRLKALLEPEVPGHDEGALRIAPPASPSGRYSRRSPCSATARGLLDARQLSTVVTVRHVPPPQRHLLLPD